MIAIQTIAPKIPAIIAPGELLELLPPLGGTDVVGTLTVGEDALVIILCDVEVLLCRLVLGISAVRCCCSVLVVGIIVKVLVCTIVLCATILLNSTMLILAMTVLVVVILAGAWILETIDRRENKSILAVAVNHDVYIVILTY